MAFKKSDNANISMLSILSMLVITLMMIMCVIIFTFGMCQQVSANSDIDNIINFDGLNSVIIPVNENHIETEDETQYNETICVIKNKR